jgi:hypothetical protein
VNDIELLQAAKHGNHGRSAAFMLLALFHLDTAFSRVEPHPFLKEQDVSLVD